MPGKNAPPMHPNCRCSVSAYEDDTEYEVFIDGKNVGIMKTGLGGKLSLSVELEAAGEVPVKIVEA